MIAVPHDTISDEATHSAQRTAQDADCADCRGAFHLSLSSIVSQIQAPVTWHAWHGMAVDATGESLGWQRWATCDSECSTGRISIHSPAAERMAAEAAAVVSLHTAAVARVCNNGPEMRRRGDMMSSRRSLRLQRRPQPKRSEVVVAQGRRGGVDVS